MSILFLSNGTEVQALEQKPTKKWKDKMTANIFSSDGSGESWVSALHYHEQNQGMNGSLFYVKVLFLYLRALFPCSTALAIVYDAYVFFWIMYEWP